MQRMTLSARHKCLFNLRLCVILLMVTMPGCGSTADSDAPAAQTTSRTGSEPDPAEEGLIDADSEVRELNEYARAGANEVRDILLRENEFFVATGRGIFRYRADANGITIAANYLASSGLPSINAFILRQDADGGVWALCEDGVGFLEKDGEKWVPFTEKNGLAAGTLTDLAVSADGRRVWVTSCGGLATADTRKRQWKSYPIKNPIDILTSPDGMKVWCRRLLASNCACGRHILTSELDFATGAWRDVPDSGNCSHVAPRPVHLCSVTGRLWFWGGGGPQPPLLYDPATGKTRTWPERPNWERVEDVNTVVYSDWFGGMRPFDDGSGRMWFATGAGLWEYDPRTDRWEIHRLIDDPGCEEAVLVRPGDRKAIYWACSDQGAGIAAFDVAKKGWTWIWKPEDEFRLGEGQELLLSPDERYLWWRGPSGIVVSDLKTRDAVHLTDLVEPGFSRTKLLRFDATHKRALLGTSEGLLQCDYSGRLLNTVKPATARNFPSRPGPAWVPERSRGLCCRGRPTWHLPRSYRKHAPLMCYLTRGREK